MVLGTFVGIECGAQIVMHLEKIGLVGSVVRWVYVVFLFLIAARILVKRNATGQPGAEEPRAVDVSLISLTGEFKKT
jgi:hypothetical protein